MTKPKDTSPDATVRKNAPFRTKPEAVDRVKEKIGTAVRLAAKQQESNGPTRKKVSSKQS
jgi:hypothetical protein